MLSLYIHIPFCVRKCHYCGFYSTSYDHNLADEFLSALRSEAHRYQTTLRGRSVETVYIGGGTPTVLSNDQLGSVIAFAKENFAISPSAEWTVEANPNSLSREKLSLLLDHGVNRLSLGIQSFSDDLLAFLGRVHTARQAEEAFRQARGAGFNNISIDLIYGIPGQDDNRWRETLQRAIALGPEHIAVYSLSLDEGSQFDQDAKEGLFALPDDGLTAGLYETAMDELGRAGFEHYEISNFARPGFACRHNMNYWRRGEYAGIGPGAWSFIGNVRSRSLCDVREYVKRVRNGEAVHESRESIGALDAANERVMLALRTSRGLDLSAYAEEFGQRCRLIVEQKAALLLDSGLLHQRDDMLTLTKKGFLVAHEVLERLFL